MKSILGIGGDVGLGKWGLRDWWNGEDGVRGMGEVCILTRGEIGRLA